MITVRKGSADWGLLILRLMVGSTFILHGSQKVLGTFDGPGLAGFSQSVAEMGFPAVLGTMAALCEFIGGILVLLGFAPQLGALMLLPVMAVAIFKVHWANGYFLQNQGFEYALNLALASLAILVAGGGKFSLWDPYQVRLATPAAPPVSKEMEV